MSFVSFSNSYFMETVCNRINLYSSSMEEAVQKPTISFKTLAETKHNLIKLPCECMLCNPQVPLHLVKAPTLFCPNLETNWKSQFHVCCCVFENLEHECKQAMKNGVQVYCECARCCKACLNNDSSTKNLTCNGYCQHRLIKYIACKHYKGYCN